MKTTVDSYSFVQAFIDHDRFAPWGRPALEALFDYLEEYEDDCGEELELDVVALDCEFSPYASLQEWAADYMGDASEELGWTEDSDEDDKDDTIQEYILDHGQLIEYDGGVIVSSF